MREISKRIFSRIDYTQPAIIKFQDKDYDKCLIKDINLTGMFVVGNFKQQTGDKCIIKYSHSSATSQFYFKAAAKVIRSSIEGVGIVFTSMPLYSYVFLETTLLYESNNPLTIGQQLPENCPFKIIDKLSDNPDVNI